MGVVVLAVALLPLLGIGGMQLLKAETTGSDEGDQADAAHHAARPRRCGSSTCCSPAACVQPLRRRVPDPDGGGAARLAAVAQAARRPQAARRLPGRRAVLVGHRPRGCRAVLSGRPAAHDDDRGRLRVGVRIHHDGCHGAGRAGRPAAVDPLLPPADPMARRHRHRRARGRPAAAARHRRHATAEGRDSRADEGREAHAAHHRHGQGAVARVPAAHRRRACWRTGSRA